MASKRQRARQKRREKKLERIARRGRGRAGPTDRRANRRRASAIVLKSTARRAAEKRIGEFGPAGGVRQVARGAIRSQLGRRLGTILRQRISKVPGIGRFARTTTRARAPQVPLVFGTRARAIAPVQRGLSVRSAVPVAIGAGTAGVAFEAGRAISDFLPGGIDLARRIRDRGRRTPQRGRVPSIPFTPGGIVPTDSIVHTWVANGVPFAQLADGRVMVRRKNGTIKTFRRPRPIVLGRNPGVRDIVRADKKIDALLKVVRKRFPTPRRRHSVAHN